MRGILAFLSVAACLHAATLFDLNAAPPGTAIRLVSLGEDSSRVPFMGRSSVKAAEQGEYPNPGEWLVMSDGFVHTFSYVRGSDLISYRFPAEIFEILQGAPLDSLRVKSAMVLSTDHAQEILATVYEAMNGGAKMSADPALTSTYYKLEDVRRKAFPYWDVAWDDVISRPQDGIFGDRMTDEQEILYEKVLDACRSVAGKDDPTWRELATALRMPVPAGSPHVASREEKIAAAEKGLTTGNWFLTRLEVIYLLSGSAKLAGFFYMGFVLVPLLFLSGLYSLRKLHYFCNDYRGETWGRTASLSFLVALACLLIMMAEMLLPC